MGDEEILTPPEGDVPEPEMEQPGDVAPIEEVEYGDGE